MVIENCYLIFDKDFEKRNWMDWLKNHVSLSPPPHRFHGEISIEYDGILFKGIDTYQNVDADFKIEKEFIRQLFHGYDELFNKFQTRGFGLSYAPIRIKIEKETNEPENLYLVSNFNGIFSTNQELFEILKTWLS